MQRCRRPTLETLEDRCLLAVKAVSLADPAQIPEQTAVGGEIVLRRDVHGLFTGSYQTTGVRSVISADGRYVVFESDSPDLAPAGVDSNGVRDVFLYDNSDQSVKLVSRFPGGMAANGLSHEPVISPDGRYVAFTSWARLHPFDTDDMPDVYVWDRVLDQMVLASEDDPEFAEDGWSTSPAISNNRRVAFVTDVQGHSWVYVRDFQSGTTHRLTGDGRDGTQGFAPVISSDGSVVVYFDAAFEESGGGTSFTAYHVFADNLDTGAKYRGTQNIGPGGVGFLPDVTPDGRFVAFSSAGLGIGADDLLTNLEVYRLDLATNALTLVSVGIAEEAYLPTISADGNLVAFASRLRRSFPFPSEFLARTHVRDVGAGVTTLIDAEPPTFAFRAFEPIGPSISDSGRFVAFQTTSRNLIAGDVAINKDVFVWDREAGSLIPISVDSWGRAGDADSSQPIVSANGTAVAFLSLAGGLAERVLDFPIVDYTLDVFVRDLVGNVTRYVTASPIPPHLRSATPVAARNGANFYLPISQLAGDAMSDDGRRVVYLSRGVNLDKTGLDTDNLYDVYLRNLDGSVTSILVSINGTSKPTDGEASYATISADGNFIAFVTKASLDPIDQNDSDEDVYLYDVQAGTLTLVARVSATVKGNNSSHSPVLSSDGRYLAFVSYATNLHALDNFDSAADVYFWDRLNPFAFELVSVDVTGTGKRFADSGKPSISADGRFVAFESLAGLDPTDTDGQRDVYVWDRTLGRTFLASVGIANVEAYNPRVNREGTRVVFETGRPFDQASEQIYVSSPLGPGITPVLVSATAAGVPADHRSFAPNISGDGKRIVFASFAGNLDPLDGGFPTDVYLWEEGVPGVRLLSVNKLGTAAGSGASFDPRISVDGRYVTFTSHASDLDPSGLDTDFVGDVYLHDLQLGTTTLVSVNSDNPPTGKGNELSTRAQVSAHGEVVIFESDAFTLISNDRNLGKDVFANVRIPFAPGPNTDSDGDGVLDREEDLADNQDGDGDAIDDRLQETVASLENAFDQRIVTLKTNAGWFRDVSTTSTPGFVSGTTDAPVGSFKFAVEGLSSPSVAIQLFLPQGVAIHAPFLLGPSPDDPTNHVFEVPVFDGVHGWDQSSMTLHVVDDGPGDRDPAPGRIALELTPAVILVPGGVRGALFTEGFGNRLPIAGAKVLLDADNDGQYTAGVDLLTTTDANGRYELGTLVRRTYVVYLYEAPVGYVEHRAEVTSDGTSRRHAPGGHLVRIGRDPEAYVDFALGAENPATLRGVVRHDANRDGLANADERPVPFARVGLDVNRDGREDLLATADGNGAYEFTNLGPGFYPVMLAGPFGWQLPTVPQNVSVLGGQVVHYDVPATSLTAISGKVWHDHNGDGVIDAGEEPLQRDVYLSWNGVVIDQVASDGQGDYRLPNVYPGDSYRISIGLLPADLSTLPVLGRHDVTVGAGQQVANQDFGIALARASLRGFVWDDRNGDGQYDPLLEPKLRNAILTLVHPLTGTRTVTTNAQGEYFLLNAIPGTYQVDVEHRSIGRTSAVAVVVAEGSAATRDFGLHATGRIDGMVYHDKNGNGVRDPQEPGLNGWWVYVDLNQNGWRDPSEPLAISGDDFVGEQFAGQYAFGNLAPGHYVVSQMQQPGWVVPIHVDPNFDNFAFRDPITLVSGDSPWHVASGSVGGLPYVVASNGEGLWLFGNDPGGRAHHVFEYLLDRQDRQSLGQPYRFEEGTLETGDFDGDGIADDLRIFGFKAGAPVVTTFAQTRSIFGIQLTAIATPDGARPPDRLNVPADFDGDGRIDTASALPAGRILVTYGHRFTYLLTGFNNVSDLVAGDFNGDGRIDLVVAGDGQNARILFNNPIHSGNFLNARPLVFLGSEHLQRSLVAADFNGDGLIDLAGAQLADDGSSHPYLVNIAFGARVFLAMVTATQGGRAEFGNQRVLDSDHDGIRDDVEDSLNPGAGQLGHVVTLPAARSGGILTLEILNPAGASFSNVVASVLPLVPPGQSQPTPPRGVTFPFGFVEFFVNGLPPGGTATIRLTISGQAELPTTVWKWGKTPNNPNDDWYEFLNDGATGATIAGQQITIRYVDGQRGDDDLLPNGVIRDPIGLALVSTPSVRSIVLNDGSAQRSKIRSITVTFNQIVTLAPGAFALDRLGKGNVKLNWTTSVSEGRTVATIKFNAGSAKRGELTNGSFELRIRADRIRTSAGNGLAEDVRHGFTLRFGDHDGDGDVDQADADAFFAALGSRRGRAGYLWHLDLNGDGRIQGADAAFFLRHYAAKRLQIQSGGR